jgi:putative ABC transport system permease protein
MLKNYLTIAIRNLSRFKVYSVINIAGLAIGLACCALILLYVQHELSTVGYQALRAALSNPIEALRYE